MFFGAFFPRYFLRPVETLFEYDRFCSNRSAARPYVCPSPKVTELSIPQCLDFACLATCFLHFWPVVTSCDHRTVWTPALVIRLLGTLHSFLMFQKVSLLHLRTEFRYIDAWWLQRGLALRTAAQLIVHPSRKWALHSFDSSPVITFRPS